jgi:hypothetical protein
LKFCFCLLHFPPCPIEGFCPRSHGNLRPSQQTGEEEIMFYFIFILMRRRNLTAPPSMESNLG